MKQVWIDDHTRVDADECLFCESCRTTLYPGDSYYDISDSIYCDDCGEAVVSKMKKVVGE